MLHVFLSMSLGIIAVRLCDDIHLPVFKIPIFTIVAVISSVLAIYPVSRLIWSYGLCTTLVVQYSTSILGCLLVLYFYNYGFLMLIGFAIFILPLQFFGLIKGTFSNTFFHERFLFRVLSGISIFAPLGSIMGLAIFDKLLKDLTNS